LDGGISLSQGRYLHKEQQKTQNKRIQTPMTETGFEPTIPGFKRTKTVHDLDRAATVIGYLEFYRIFIAGFTELSTMCQTIFRLTPICS
jgi:hypothetical protein